jgi:hypothetical protein
VELSVVKEKVKYWISQTATASKFKNPPKLNKKLFDFQYF